MIEKVRDIIRTYERKLSELRIKRESIELVSVNLDKLTTSAQRFSKVLHNADYPLKLKAMEALDIRVTYMPDQTIVIDGLLPVGASNLQERLHSEKRNALPFHFCVQTKKEPSVFSPEG